MGVLFRNNCNTLDFAQDYYKIRNFLLKVANPNYLFGRWDWMITHGYLDKNGLSNIGVWEDSENIVALATYDCKLGVGYFLVQSGYEYLKKEMLQYASEKLSIEGKFKAVINDCDKYFQDIAFEMGFLPTQDKECDAVYQINVESINYKLPEGFTITSMKSQYDIYKYGQVLWKGFNHELNGEGIFNLSESKNDKSSFERPNVDLDLKIAVVTPNGDFVSYCGMWFDKNSKYALVEPVATDPAYRKLGLGKAAVLEGIKRCGLLGAEKAFVGSSQQFYYNIGFRPYGTCTLWEIKSPH